VALTGAWRAAVSTEGKRHTMQDLTKYYEMILSFPAYVHTTVEDIYTLSNYKNPNNN